MNDGPEAQRLDKWLWAARFFKTRSLAGEAIDAGRVLVNGQRCRASRNIRVGDRLDIRRSQERWEIAVRGLNAQRRPASEASSLWEETAQGRERRERERLERQLDGQGRIGERPTKRDRRQLERWRGGEG